MPQNAIKILIPALVALALVGGGFMYFWNGMVESALMGSSATFGKRMENVVQGDPRKTSVCTPGAPAQWIGCSIK